MCDGGEDGEEMMPQLSERDQAEIERFSEFLRDRKSMSRNELYKKHQEYLGLDDIELANFLVNEK